MYYIIKLSFYKIDLKMTYAIIYILYMYYNVVYYKTIYFGGKIIGELKVKSFRIDDETADKFKEISTAIGGNQQETFVKLIETYEFQSGKTVLTEKKADIEQFEKYVTILTRMYMTSLEDNQNITETVRVEFDALLKSKDAIIQELQEKVKSHKFDVEESRQNEDRYKSEVIQLQEEMTNLKKEQQSQIEHLQDLLSSKEAMLVDKESLNKTLANTVNELNKEIDAMAVEQRKIGELSGKIESLVAKNKSLEDEKQRLQLEHEKEILLLERKHSGDMDALKEQQTTEINIYQEKYKELLEKLEQKTEKPATSTKKATAKSDKSKQTTKPKKAETLAAEAKEN